jgi:hypothetical protein
MNIRFDIEILDGLSPVKQEKIALIRQINDRNIKYRSRSITTNEFDYLYELSINSLITIKEGMDYELNRVEGY